MDVYEAIRTRKSVRKYLDEEVAEDVLTRILEAARLAPSAHNRQEWRFVVVRDKKTRKQLYKAAGKQKFVAQAPVVVACCAETDGHQMLCGEPSYPIDVSIAVDHLTLAAVAEGLGTCWIGHFHQDQVKEILHIPSDIRIVDLLTLGHPKDPAPVEKRRLPLETIVKYERWD